MEFKLSYFKSWKMMLWKCCTQYASKFGKSALPQDWKRSVFIPIPKKGSTKEYSNYHTIALILHTSKVMLKILQARLQKYMNRELPDVQPRFRKGRGTRAQIVNICWIIEIYIICCFNYFYILSSPLNWIYVKGKNLWPILFSSHFVYRKTSITICWKQ